MQSFLLDIHLDSLRAQQLTDPLEYYSDRCRRPDGVCPHSDTIDHSTTVLLHKAQSQFFLCSFGLVEERAEHLYTPLDLIECVVMGSGESNNTVVHAKAKRIDKPMSIHVSVATGYLNRLKPVDDCVRGQKGRRETECGNAVLDRCRTKKRNVRLTIKIVKQ